MEKINNRCDYVYVNRRTFVWAFSYMSEKTHIQNWTVPFNRLLIYVAKIVYHAFLGFMVKLQMSDIRMT